MIKYHDNLNGVQYGEDHMLTNNWNPDLDYGNEYVDVHFRIETPSYYTGSGVGFQNNEDRDAFTAEKLKVFLSIGWTCAESEYNGRCMVVVKGKQHLYLHPQDFSGYVLKNEVKAIAEALEQHETFSIRWVDLYKTVYDISDAAYRRILQDKTEEIRKLVFESCKTNRRNQFKYQYEVLEKIGVKVGLPRVDDGSTHHSNQVARDYVLEVVNDLIDEGYLDWIMSDDGYRYIRTRNATELKKAKLKAIA